AGDIRVGCAARDEVRDLALAVAQAGEVTGRPCARSASPRADAKLAQELVDMRPLRRGASRLGDRRGDWRHDGAGAYRPTPAPTWHPHVATRSAHKADR